MLEPLTNRIAKALARHSGASDWETYTSAAEAAISAEQSWHTDWIREHGPVTAGAIITTGKINP